MRTIDTKELRKMKQNQPNLLLVNVLSRDQFEEEHIPGSINVPLETDNFIAEMETRSGTKERPIVVYCASKECTASPTAARKLEEAGFKNIHDYEGGVKAWSEAGLPTVQAATQTS